MNQLFFYQLKLVFTLETKFEHIKAELEKVKNFQQAMLGEP